MFYVNSHIYRHQNMQYLVNLSFFGQTLLIAWWSNFPKQSLLQVFAVKTFSRVIGIIQKKRILTFWQFPKTTPDLEKERWWQNILYDSLPNDRWNWFRVCLQWETVVQLFAEWNRAVEGNSKKSPYSPIHKGSEIEGGSGFAHSSRYWFLGNR